MFDSLLDILAKNDKQGGWKEFLPMIVIFGIIILKNLSNFKFGKDKDAGKPRPAQRPSSEPPKRRYTPLDEKIRQRQHQAPVQRPIRRQDSFDAAPLEPAQAKIMPEHDHTREFAAKKKYQQEQLELARQKKRAEQQRLLARHVRQKAIKKPEPEIIETTSEVRVESFVSNPTNLRTAFIMSEILAKPIAMR